MGPNIIYDRAPNMSDPSNTPVHDSSSNACDRVPAWNGPYLQEPNGYDRVPSWNGAYLQEPRTTGSPALCHPHYERLPAEQEQQKFLLNNGIQLNDCHPDVRRKLNEMFFRGADLKQFLTTPAQIGLLSGRDLK
uniref:Uncharacterized protein n=1 Tax=Cacopsylla melanoneura TaxID=428564 RepID=A0A8D8WWC3_9HEMI